MSVDSVEKLFLDELKDLYSAEHQITRALPKMAKAATSPELRAAV
jgi:ferritin-like metal-binding protein YciE